MSFSPLPTPGRDYDLEAEIERLHKSIDILASAVSGLRSDATRQAENLEQLSSRQTSDFKELMSKVHDNYRTLIDLQRDALTGFGDRLDKLLSRQEEQATAIRNEMRTDFSRIVDRQDSHSRWLIGIVVAAAISIGLAIYKSH